MKRLLIMLTVLGLVAGPLAAAQAEHLRRTERTVEGSYGAYPAPVTGCNEVLGSFACLIVDTHPTERFFTAKVTDVHGQPVRVEVRSGGSRVGVFCGATAQPTAFPAGASLEFHVGLDNWGITTDCPAHRIKTTGTISVTLSNRLPASAVSRDASAQHAPSPSARTIDAACPADRVPDNRFGDVVTGSTHERAISCVVWWKVANGRTPTSYAPAAGVTRDAMAAFVARKILEVEPGALSDNPPDAFTDDNGSVHQKAINQLAAAGIVAGTGGGTYSPGLMVTRGQMAKFLAETAEHVLGEPLPGDHDFFSDDDTSPFQDDINRVAQAGLTGGRADRTYTPTGPVLRDQMGSFLARSLDLFVSAGAQPPE